MKNKTLFIILDGLDYIYIEKNIEKLKTFKGMKAKKRFRALPSVIPADSIPSWITIYTGLNPAQHGVIESIDYLNFKAQVQGDYSIIKGLSVWDHLGERGKKCFVFNPFMAYPAWDINGLMVSGPVFEGGEISTNRPDVVDVSNLPHIGGMVDQPTDKQMPEFFKDTMKLSQDQFNAFHQYFSTGEYDFGFLGITTPDRIQHFLWRYTDTEDRTYPGKNQLQNSILEMYQLMDRNTGEMINRYGDDYNIVVISDHGHGRRCQKTFYVNEWLIQSGFIKDKRRKKRCIEYAKNKTLRILASVKQVERGTRFLKKFKFAHKVKNADYVFKSNDAAVFAPKFDGCNPYGGISVKREKFASDTAYEAMRLKIIDGLMKVQDHGKNIVQWAKRREDIYEGAKVENYPEIIYHMNVDYGVDRGLYGKHLFGINAMHEVLSGGHMPNGVIMSNEPIPENIQSVHEISNYIISLFD